jgi:putative DNA primase/helicase
VVERVRIFNPAPETTLDDLASSPRWVAWREEERTTSDGATKRTKVPYSPHSGRMARIPTDPTSWGTREQAAHRWAQMDDGRCPGGIGIVLGDIDGDCVWGIDLDNCITAKTDGKQSVAPWAAQVIKRINSYAEVSPSKRGTKTLFLAQPEWAPMLGTNDEGDPKTRLSFAAGEHHEIALDRARFYCITGEQIAGSATSLRPVSIDDVRWLIDVAGPAFKREHQPDRADHGRSDRDESGSGCGFRFMRERKAAGRTYEEAVADIKADTGRAGEWARRTDNRELRRAYERSQTGALVLPAHAPVAAAKKFVEMCCREREVPILRHYRGGFYLWAGTHYRHLSEAELEHKLYTFLNDALVPQGNNLAPYNPNKNKVAEVAHALRRSDLLVPEEWEAPFWLGTVQYKPAGGLIACGNGILDVKRRTLQPHDPLFFTPNALPFDYDANAPEPERFLQLLREIWPQDADGNRDEEAEGTLLEIFGYLLTSDTRQQKIFLMVGPRRGGKGTLVFVAEQLLGSDNITYQTLDSLTGEFGRWPLIDKKLCVIADARLGERGNIHRLVETLLSISGGDPQTINRKYGTFWSGRLPVRFLITTNVLPALKDASGTIASRFILLKLTESFYGREDTELQDKLVPELPGILNLVLDGLDRLRARGYFQQPSSSKDQIQLLEDLAAPVGAFFREWCYTDAEASISVKHLYNAYKAWAEDAGQRALPRHMFGKELRDVVTHMRKPMGKGKARKYVGFDLSDEGQAAWDTLLEDKGGRRRA